MRAVALGGQGRYAQARAALRPLGRTTSPGTPVASLALSTQASLLRQLGWHRIAAGFDGKALAAVSAISWRSDQLAHQAWCDAMTGLAADALGCGRLELGWRLLDRVGDRLDAIDEKGALWRQHVRLHWVTAELSLAAADFTRALSHADAASELSVGSGSVRHTVKSDLLRAAAMTGGADTEAPRALSIAVLERCDEHGLVPLKWAAAMLVGGVTSDAGAFAVRDECFALIERRGGWFRR